MQRNTLDELELMPLFEMTKKLFPPKYNKPEISYLEEAKYRKGD